MLDRASALQELVGDPTDFLVVAGLGSAVFDMARLTENANTVFPLDGTMGAAVSVGLGLATQRPHDLVLVVTGDGELLMNVGALATVAVQQPANLAVLCLDNGYYGLTGGQVTHTASGTDLEAMARAAGIRATMTCTDATHLAAGAALLRDTGSTSFVLAKVKPDPSPRYPVERDGPTCRIRFRSAVLARK